MNLNIENTQLSPNSLYIHSPKFIDLEKKRVRGIVRLPSGEFKEFDGHIEDKKNPFTRDLLLQYSVEDIEKNTEREKIFQQKKEELTARLQEDQIRDEEFRLLAKAKSEAFKIEIFQDDTYKEIKRKIRRASNVLEVTALVSCAYVLESQKK